MISSTGPLIARWVNGSSVPLKVKALDRSAQSRAIGLDRQGPRSGSRRRCPT
jgi:hypothetical protein